MEAPSEAFLKANAIIRSEVTNKLVCAICLEDRNVKDWKSHTEKERHVATLERFNCTFKNLTDEVCCKICDSNVSWDTIKTHAKAHMVVPWYDPEDKNKIFYENHTLKFGSNYYCYLCDEIFQEWFTVYTSIGGEEHQRIVQGIQQCVPTKGSKKFYVDLISSGFVPGNDGTVECRFCNESDLGYHITREHASSQKHMQNKSEFNEKLIKRMANDSLEKQAIESSENKESKLQLLKVEASKESCVPLNRSVTSDRNMICNFRLEQEATHSVAENPQKEKTQMQMEEENTSEASKSSELCHEYIPHFIVSSAHSFCNEAKPIKDKKKKAKMVEGINNDPDPFCLICWIEIPGLPAIKDHIKGERHANSLIKHGCENIVCIEGDCYYCQCCDWTITSFDNVYRHVIGTAHTTSIGGPRSDFDTDEAAQMEIPEEEDKTCIYVVRKNAKKSFCQICDDTPYPIASKNIKDHISGQRHKLALLRYGCNNIAAKSNDYYCRCCNIELSNLENVFLHIKDKRHTSSMIKVAHKQKPQTRKRMREKFEVPEIPEMSIQPPCRNLLSDYIFIQVPLYISSDLTESSSDLYSSLYLNRFEPPESARLFGPPTYRNAIGNNMAGNSFWEFPKQFEFPRQLMPHESQNLRSIYGNNNFASNNEASRFYRYPSQNGIFRLDEFQAQPELNTVLSSMASELSRFLQHSESGQARNLQWPKFDERFLEHAAPMEKIYCDLCDECVNDMTALHVHMASHFVNEFILPKRNRYVKSSNKDYSQIYRNCIDESQSTLIPNGHVFYGHRTVMSFNNAGNGDPTNSILPQDSSDRRNSAQEVDQTFPLDRHANVTARNNESPQKSGNSPKKMNMKKVIASLNFKDDEIYDMKDKLSDIEQGLKLCLIIDPSKIYCLICQDTVKSTYNNYFEHLNSVDHCEYLEGMEQDSDLFSVVPDQFSDLDLAQQYMQEISDETVRCFICDQEIVNDDRSLRQHIYEENHARKGTEIRMNASKKFQEIKQRIHCDWYKVQKYWCVLCLTNTESEVSFVKHLVSPKHRKVINNSENCGKRLIFDFCEHCALLWYGYRCTYSYHSTIDSHKWLTRDGHFVTPGLPKFAMNLLTEPEEFIENKIKYFDDIYEIEHQKEQRLIEDMEKAVRVRFSRTKAYIFGSRVSGLGSPDSDIDIYLDCRNMYDGNDISESLITFFMTGVHQCLSKDAQLWDVEELLLHCRSPIIRVHHRATGLNCDISFQNGLSVENTKLIKTFNSVFPMCRKLILLLKQWLAYCDLTGSDRISSYALYWFVIFYLQKESILPSVAMLIAMSKKSRIVAGWEVGVTQNFNYNKLESNHTLKEYLVRFFKFYANFNFRQCVACPLLGEERKKNEFSTPENLPKEMALYVDYVRKNQTDAEPFRIDSVMCIQDPFDLQHNLTKAVSKVYLSRFRTCCLKSLNLLCSD